MYPNAQKMAFETAAGLHRMSGYKFPDLDGPMKRLLGLSKLIVVYAVTAASIAAQTTNIAELIRKSDAGDPKAQFDLAQAFWTGTGVPKDSTRGLELLKKSASQDYAGAEVTLGLLYQNGVQVAKDPHEAARWFRRAARQTDKDAKHAQIAQADLATLASQGLILISEADWRAPEPGSAQVKPVKDNPPKGGDGKGSDAKVKGAPFSLSEVETGLNGGITSKRMAALITQYGVDFALNSNAKTRLGNDGADDTLLQTIASSKR